MTYLRPHWEMADPGVALVLTLSLDMFSLWEVLAII